MSAVFKKDGKFLQYREHTTHTGTARIIDWVDDLQMATVFHVLPSANLIQGAEALDATETRTVTLVDSKFDISINEQQKAKIKQGYKNRPGTCISCKYYTSKVFYLRECREETEKRCSLGGFAVHTMATCNKHKLKESVK